MNRETLLSEIQEDLALSPEAGEEEGSFRSRLIYSAAGRMTLASLWDMEEKRQKRGAAIATSMGAFMDRASGPGEVWPNLPLAHLKSMLKARLSAFMTLYPEGAELLPPPEDLSQEIQEIYGDAGFFYHRPYWAAPALPNSASFGHLTLHRAGSPFLKSRMSGLGLYTFGHETARMTEERAKNLDTTREIREMFLLPPLPLIESLQEILRTGDYESVKIPKHAEFLKMHGPFAGGFWIPPSDREKTNLTLMRVRIRKMQYSCILLTGDGRGVEVSDWKRAAAALLIWNKAMPKIRVSLGKSTALVELPYPLPEEEEALFRLLTWPVRKSSGAGLSGRMALPVYELFRSLVLEDGYEIEEKTGLSVAA